MTKRERRKRKPGLLAPHRKLIERLLKGEASHHRFYERDLVARADREPDRVLSWTNETAGAYWRKEAARRASRAELAEDALIRLKETV